MRNWASNHRRPPGRSRSALSSATPRSDHAHQGVGAAARLAVRGYEMREHVGEGRFGPVYRAFQPYGWSRGRGRGGPAPILPTTRSSSVVSMPGQSRWPSCTIRASSRFTTTGGNRERPTWSLRHGGTSLAEAVRGQPMPPVEAARLVDGSRRCPHPRHVETGCHPAGSRLRTWWSTRRGEPTCAMSACGSKTPQGRDTPNPVRLLMTPRTSRTWRTC